MERILAGAQAGRPVGTAVLGPLSVPTGEDDGRGADHPHAHLRAIRSGRLQDQEGRGLRAHHRRRPDREHPARAGAEHQLRD